MKTAICTLFEGTYHLGLAGLVNSLVANGFEGDIYAGYRGTLPPWASANGVADRDMQLTEKVSLRFIKLGTDYHFTNYKPDFMLDLLNGHAKDVEAIYYFDPDIVVAAHWDSFDEWLTHGVALCEDVNSPIAAHHPKRAAWRSYFGKHGVALTHKGDTYVNGGCVGLTRKNIRFLQSWKQIQELMAGEIGGLSRSSLAGKALDKKATTVFAPFNKTDQDALNAAIEASDVAASIATKDAMGFTQGLTILPHALGTPKPWDKNYINRSLDGYPPRQVDKLYWKFANGVIKSMSDSKVQSKLRAIKFAAWLGRFYRRS